MIHLEKLQQGGCKVIIFFSNVLEYLKKKKQPTKDLGCEITFISWTTLQLLRKITHTRIYGRMSLTQDKHNCEQVL